jgi:DNA-binding NarL/FixJ family response regulator
MHEENIYAERCLRAGGRGYMMKSEGPEKLAAAICDVLAGRIYVSPQMSSRIVASFAGRQPPKEQTPVSKLTDREFEVFQSIGAGLSTKGIADRLHLSPKTIETHRLHIKAKLNLGSAAELVAYAARWVATEG